MAVVSLMTASALSQVAESGSQDYVAAALVLALLCGAILLIMGLCRLGFLVNFLSHPVMTGFVSASGVLIAASQLEQLLGVDLSGSTLPALLSRLPSALESVSLPTVIIGMGSLLLLWLIRRWGKPVLEHLSLIHI